MAFKLHPKRDPGWEVMRVVARLAAQTRRRLANGDDSAAERIHETRTACKQMRAALKLVRSADRKRYRRDNRWLRDTARVLAGLRDAEASVLGFELLCRPVTPSEKRRLLEPVGVALRRRRDVLAAPGSALDRRLGCVGARLEKFEARLSGWRPALEFGAIAVNFRRTYAIVRSALRAARKQQTGESFHAWRKATKTCAYQCCLLRAASAPALKRLRHGLKELARQLGDEHDLTVLLSHLYGFSRGRHRSAGADSVHAASNAAKQRRAVLRASALVLGARVLVARPAHVAAQLKQAWRVARERRSND